MSKILGFCGKAGAGKDTAADYFLEQGYAHVKFARHLKEMVAKSFELPMYYLEQPMLKDKPFDKPFKPTNKDVSRLISNIGKAKYKLHKRENRNAIKEVLKREFKTPRDILQTVGTDIIRDLISDTYWVDIVRPILQSWVDRNENVVISDVRFENEAALIKEFNGQVIEISRENNKNEQTHISDNITLDINKKVCNNGSIEEFNEELKGLDEGFIFTINI